MTRTSALSASSETRRSKKRLSKFIETTERLKREREVGFIKHRVRVPALRGRG